MGWAQFIKSAVQFGRALFELVQLGVTREYIELKVHLGQFYSHAYVNRREDFERTEI